MAFYMSPLVDVKEFDTTDMVSAVPTSIGAILLRNTLKGPEFERKLITNSDELVNTYGLPTKEIDNYRDMLSAMGFLLQSSQLYCVRVMPEDSTFSGTRVTSAGAGLEFDDPFKLSDLESQDPNYFHEDVYINDPADLLWIISSSRGEWSNKIRIAICSKTDLEQIRDGEYPSSWTAPQDDQSPYWVISSIDTKLDTDKDFLIVVEEQDLEGMWSVKEVFNVSTLETAIDEMGEIRYVEQALNESFVERAVNESSDYLRVNLSDEIKNTDWFLSTDEYIHLTGGSNGSDLSEADLMFSLSLFESAEEVDVNLFIDSDKPASIKKEMIRICEKRKDCMAILDPPASTVVNNRGNEVTELTNWRNAKGIYVDNNLNDSTSYAALYGNWLEVFDPYNNRYRWIPASGYVAGVYANTDRVRDPWWAPAGFNRAVLRGRIRRLAFNPDQPKRDMLYRYNINPITSFAGEGKVVYGQKTLLSKNSAFSRVNVRRLFIVLEKSIATSAKYFLFEPNDGFTRNQFTNMVKPFLREVEGRRGIYAYRVICNDTNNTPYRIDQNEMHASIMVQPTRSAEFIVLSFIATSTGASFEEAFLATQ